MGTNRLDLGRVRGDDGANGHPAVVEVLEETATSYVLGITYYDDGGVEHVIQTPNLKGADGSATFTVSSDADLRKWMDAEAGNNYTCVLVKPAAYTLSGTVDLAAAGTEAVMGFGASLPQIELRGSGSEMVIGLEARACTDVLLVAADGGVRCSNLRGELLEASAADALAAPATAVNYGKIRYGQAKTGGSKIAGVTPAKLRAGIRAPCNPSSPWFNVFYVQGDGNDYVLERSRKLGMSGFNMPSAVKRVLASLYGGKLRLHILTTDGRLFYAAEQNGALRCVELASGLPTEPLTDIAYNPGTDWSSAAPFPVMLTATKLYRTPTQSVNVGGVECYYMGTDIDGSILHLVRGQHGLISAFKDFVYNGTDQSSIPADAVFYPTTQALLVKASSAVKVIKYNDDQTNAGWTLYEIDNPNSTQYTPQVRFSPDVFPDGFSASALFDDDIVGLPLMPRIKIKSTRDSWYAPLFMTAPRVLDGKLMSLVMVQEDFQSSGLKDFYAKLVVWEGLEDFDSAAGVMNSLNNSGEADYTVSGCSCYAFKDNKTYNIALAVEDFTYKETSEHKVGIGFVEKQEVNGVMEYKAGDGAVFLTKEGVQEAVASAKSASVSEVIVHNSGCNRWLRFDPTHRKGLVIKGGTSVSAMINGARVSHTFEQDTAFDLTSALEAYVAFNYARGLTFAVYLADIGGQSPTMLIRLLSEQAPADGVLLGWFSTLCASVGSLKALVPIPSGYSEDSLTVKPYSADTDPDFVTLYAANILSTSSASGASEHVKMALVWHPLGSFNEGDILPESVWCRDFHPACVSIKGNRFTGCPDAMVFDAATGKAVDVYGMHRNPVTRSSGTMQWTSSRYCDVNGVLLNPLTPVAYDVCKVSMLTVGKSLMTRADFYSASIGSPQHAALESAPEFLGGYSINNEDDHPNKGASGRMISFIGCESMCGVVEQWLDGEEPGTLDRITKIANDIDESFGAIWGATTRVLKTAGGTATASGASWIDSSGSLAMQVYSESLPDMVTGRGVCRVISGTRGQA